MTANTADLMKKYKKRSPVYSVWLRFKRNRMAVAGLVLLGLLLLIALCAPFIASHELVIKQDLKTRFISPGKDHWFGTDALGRDMFARVIWGARYSLSLGIGAVLISMSIGSVIGSVAGYYGGRIDSIIMRIIDIIMAIPGTLMAITIVAALGAGTTKLLIAMSISLIPTFSRIVRAIILNIREEEYIESARSYGSRDSRIIMKHIWPNSMGPLIVQASLSMAQAVLTISSLSFIGLGVPAPTPEWGTILSENKANMRNYAYLCTIPGFAILLSVIAMNLIGDGLRDALDPKLKN